MIDDDIKVTILGINGQQIRVGIDAPRDVEIHRLEIWEKIKADEARNPEQ